MAKKNKKNNQSQQFKPSAPKQLVITQEVINEAKVALEESAVAIEFVPAKDVNVSAIEAAYVTDGSVSSEDIVKCVADLKKSIKILNSTQVRYEELKSQLEEDKKQWKEKKAEDVKKLTDSKKTAEEEISKQKKELAEMRDELNNRELKLIEDETNTREGDHSAVIERLINAFKKSKEQVLVFAETQLQDQVQVTNDYLDRLDKVVAKEHQLDVRESELKIRERKVAVKEEVINDERSSMHEEIMDELRDEFEDRLSTALGEKCRCQSQLEKSNREIDRLKEILETIKSAFGDIDPSEMSEVCFKQKTLINKLQDELSTRPHQNDLDTKQKEVELLMQNINEIREKLNEKEYYELRAMFDNNDMLIRDKQLLIDKIESAKVREGNLKDTIDDLRSTISEINESHNKDNAFKASSKYDTGDYRIPLVKGTAPSSLPAFINYLQSFMASPENGDKELRYSKDTIKKFIAGLHMSPISILQGISGTGKTSLPRAVAMAMTADDTRYSVENGDDELPKAPYRVCPIQSGWRDKMDLIGFYNSFEKSYHETEFFNALYLANQPKYKEILFFIVLDEMNLSRPEHYFADFLSKLEQSENQRKIKIDNVPDDICPKSIIGGTLTIPKNVRFIGTANHDETTLEFAPKTYDRSNVIDMPRNCPNDYIPNFEKRYNVTYKWLNSKFAEAEKNHVEECQIFDNFIKDENLAELLAERGIGIGNRFEGQAKRFLSVFVEAGEDVKVDTAKAADHLMTTRLLRTLKDNYDLGYDTLDDFKERYKTLFYLYFDNEPTEAIELIDKELDKKK